VVQIQYPPGLRILYIKKLIISKFNSDIKKKYIVNMDLSSILCGVGFMVFMSYLIKKLWDE